MWKKGTTCSSNWFKLATIHQIWMNNINHRFGMSQIWHTATPLKHPNLEHRAAPTPASRTSIIPWYSCILHTMKSLLGSQTTAATAILCLLKDGRVSIAFHIARWWLLPFKNLIKFKRRIVWGLREFSSINPLLEQIKS